MGLAPYLDGRFFIVSVRAPFELGPGMYGWFHVQLDPTAPIIHSDEAEHSRRVLVQFVAEIGQAYGVDARRHYLLGFSQGAIMSLSLALTHPDMLAGVVAMSGRILPEVLPKMASPETMRGLPVLVVHGTEDPVLPIHHGRSTRDRLSALPVSLTYREYPIGHYVSEEILTDVTTWLQQRLDEPPWTERLARRPSGTNQ